MVGGKSEGGNGEIPKFRRFLFLQLSSVEESKFVVAKPNSNAASSNVGNIMSLILEDVTQDSRHSPSSFRLYLDLGKGSSVDDDDDSSNNRDRFLEERRRDVVMGVTKAEDSTIRRQ